MKAVLVLLGPTGVGKTGASILLAKALQTEIISADSMQIYRGMDIGTAKPSADELREVKHHMIDIADPTVSFSAGDFIEAVTPILEGLTARGKVPLVVGGTGLYIRAMTRGLFSGPSADWNLRHELLSMEEQAPGILHAHLERLDREVSEKIEKNDTRRTVRALEVFLKGGQKMSSLQESLTRPLPYAFIKTGLTRDRKELYMMIDHRVDMMMQAGLTGEVEKVLAAKPDQTPLQAIGYKETADYIRGKTTLEEANRLIKRNSRRYAKRQFTWFRKEEGITWVDITGISDSREICRLILDSLRKNHPELPFLQEANIDSF